MTEPRRYRDDEVAEIFETAASERRSAASGAPAAEGFTLAELQSIGGEVGLAPAQVAGAAAALDLRRGAVPPRTSLGMPVSAGRTITLPREPTDRDWEVLLGELRATFGARGTDRSTGSLRQWSNGNLHACVEPTEDGHRLRLGTTKGNAAATNLLGLGALLVAAVMLMASVLSGGESADLAEAALFAAMGIVALGLNATRLPRWSAERHAQMEHVARRAQAIMAGAPAEPALAAAGASGE